MSIENKTNKAIKGTKGIDRVEAAYNFLSNNYKALFRTDWSTEEMRFYNLVQNQMTKAQAAKSVVYDMIMHCENNEILQKEYE